MIRESPFFDADWYRQRYADVAAAGIDPASHYLDNGWREGRDPCPSFSTSAYLRSNSDVARSGVNPLLHFIEFGYSEGRNIGEARTSITTAANEATKQFGPPAPCISFEVKERPALRWRRAARLRVERDNPLVIGGEPIGLATDRHRRSLVEEAFERLAAFSGCAAGAGQRREHHAHTGNESSLLHDAWFVANARLRCRWSADDRPIVVRSYQHDPRADGALNMVGEGLIASALDFVDANLKNPYFPVLFVLSDSEGSIQSVQLLAFPSLCRGGLHYTELVALEHASARDESRSFNLIGQSQRLAARLSGIVDGSNLPFVGRLTVDLAGADGTEPLFQPDFQRWLSNVIQIGVEPFCADSAKSTKAFLATAASVSIDRRKGGSNMVLPADVIPSISSLVAAAGSAKIGNEMMMPLAIAETDAAQPATLIRLPISTPPTSGLATQDYVAPWPRFEDANQAPREEIEIVAIRHPRRALPRESEILVPVAQPALHLAEPHQAITWLIFPEDWDADALRQSLEALALQQGSPPAVSLVGEIPDSVVAIATRLFMDGLSVSTDLTSALDAVRTPLLGYLGQHVILHDTRTSRVLSTLLRDPAVVSSSCVVVSAEKRGKGWQVSVTDAGKFGGRGGDQTLRPEHAQDVLRFWRSVYPALRPPRDLWVGRSESVKGWLQRAGPLRPQEGVQLCTSMITASYVAAADDRPAHLSPPASAEQRAISTEVLFG
jgi:hypothetical protein